MGSATLEQVALGCIEKLLEQASKSKPAAVFLHTCFSSWHGFPSQWNVSSREQPHSALTQQ